MVRGSTFASADRDSPGPGILEKELRCHLHNAGVARTGDHSKRGVDLARRIHELRMIEKIECLKAQLQFLGFGNWGCLQQSHIPVIEARPMKEAPRRISELSKLFVAKERRIEISATLSRIGSLQDVSAGKVGNVNRNGIGADERVVIILRHRDRQSGSEVRNP